MSTLAFIACKQPRGGYLAIQCFHDGYLDGVGKTLVQHYSDPTKVNELIALGDLSELGDEIGTKHDLITCDPAQCTAYKRDGNETDTDAQFVNNYTDLLANYHFYVYIYVYDPENNTWYWLNNKNILQPVRDALDE